MNKDEFGRWVEYHGYAFPRWAEELGRLPARGMTLASWRVALADVTFASSTQATDELLGGKFGKAPFEIQAHVTFVATRAKELDAAASRPPMKYASEPRLRCAICKDNGAIVVVDPNGEDGELSRAAAWCGCEIGQRLERAESALRAKRSPHVPPQPCKVYDPDRHVRWTWNEEAMRESLKSIKPANHVAEFATWNGGE